MAQDIIAIGAANAKLGDKLFDAFTKTNANFTELFNNTLSSTIVVNQDNLATTLGAAIDSTKVYILDGVVDFTGTGLNIELPVGGMSILGSTFDISGIKCSDGGYTLFTSPGGGSGNLLRGEFFIEISGVGSQVQDITDATGNNSVEEMRINYNNCSSLGTMANYRQGLETGTGRFGGTPELTLKGPWSGGYFIDVSIVRGLTDGSYSLYKAGVGFVMASRFRSNQNIDLPANVSFLDFSPSNFTNPSTLQLEDCLITRNGVSDASDTNLTPNISAGDLVSDWSRNNGLSNTFVGGELNITAEVTTTIVTGGVFVDLAGTYTASDLQHFDEPADGQLRHQGDSPREYTVQGQIVTESTANDDIAIKVVIFRSATTSFEDGKTFTRVINNLVGGRNVAYFVLIDNIILNKNDYVKLQTANVSSPASTDDVTAELGSFFNVEAR